MQNVYDKLRQECWDKALDALGYSYIYSKRIVPLERLQKWTVAMGFVIPVAVGGIVSAYITNNGIIDIAIWISSPLAVIQLIMAAYLTGTGAGDRLAKYTKISIQYSLLNSEFEQLAKFPPSDVDTLQNKFNVLLERERNLSEQNFEITDKEERKGMRYGLRNYRRSCAGCDISPISMKATNCDVCGNF